MAKIVDIVNEFELVAKAFEDVGHFIYDRLSSVNASRVKTWPLVLLESTPETTFGKLNNKFLPKSKTYRFRLFVFDDYDISEKKTIALQQKESDVEDILNRYLAEIIERNTSSPGWRIEQPEQIRGLIAHDVHNGKLVQSSITFSVVVDSDCVNGVFNY